MPSGFLPIPSHLCTCFKGELTNPGATIARLGAFVTSFLEISAGTCAGLDLNGSFSPLGRGFGADERWGAWVRAPAATAGLCALGPGGGATRWALRPGWLCPGRR